MRIIGGKYRGKKLEFLENESTKPTADIIKENMFNILGAKVYGSVCLDLFGGTGALGIECISRGAKQVYIVDNNGKAIKNIKNNINSFKEEDVNSIFVEYADYSAALHHFGVRGIKFDLIFLDPPYHSDFAIKTLKKIREYNLLNSDGIVLWEHSADINVNLKPSCPFYAYSERIYGEKALTFFRC